MSTSGLVSASAIFDISSTPSGSGSGYQPLPAAVTEIPINSPSTWYLAWGPQNGHVVPVTVMFVSIAVVFLVTGLLQVFVHVLKRRKELHTHSRDIYERMESAPSRAISLSNYAKLQQNGNYACRCPPALATTQPRQPRLKGLVRTLNAIQRKRIGVGQMQGEGEGEDGSQTDLELKLLSSRPSRDTSIESSTTVVVEVDVYQQQD